MYTPEYVIRLEFAQTDIDNLREWRVALGGSQRGGMSVDHDYMPISGPALMEHIERAIEIMRESVEAYASTLGCYQLQLDTPS